MSSGNFSKLISKTKNRANKQMRKRFTSISFDHPPPSVTPEKSGLGTMMAMAEFLSCTLLTFTPEYYTRNNQIATSTPITHNKKLLMAKWKRMKLNKGA
jgi:hypothetical protein